MLYWSNPPKPRIFLKTKLKIFQKYIFFFAKFQNLQQDLIKKMYGLKKSVHPTLFYNDMLLQYNNIFWPWPWSFFFFFFLIFVFYKLSFQSVDFEMD